jgi:ketosteroid isomerase-like protein
MATMPESVSRYLDLAAERDVATLLGCFTGDAVVHDEGQTFHGHDEIRRWRETVTSRFTYTVTVLGSEESGPTDGPSRYSSMATSQAGQLSCGSDSPFATA